MFLGLRKKNSESGVVLFIVLMTVIIMMIISAIILSQSINEVNFAQQQIDEIATDQLMKGVFWNRYSFGNIQNFANGMDLNNRSYTYNLTVTPLAGGVNRISVVSNYDSFN